MDSKSFVKDISKARKCSALGSAGVFLVVGIVMAGLSLASLAESVDLVTSNPQRWYELEKVINPNAVSSLQTEKPDLVSAAGLSFHMPQAADGNYAVYMVSDYYGSLAGMKMTVTVQISSLSTATPAFDFYDPTDSYPTEPPCVRLFFQDKLGGWNCSDYWWSIYQDSTLGLTGHMELDGVSSFTLTTAFLPQYWSDIWGHVGSSNEWHIQEFNDALDDIHGIGLSLGGQFHNYAAGIGLTSGDAMFVIESCVISEA